MTAFFNQNRAGRRVWIGTIGSEEAGAAPNILHNLNHNLNLTPEEIRQAQVSFRVSLYHSGGTTWNQSDIFNLNTISCFAQGSSGSSPGSVPYILEANSISLPLTNNIIISRKTGALGIEEILVKNTIIYIRIIY